VQYLCIHAYVYILYKRIFTLCIYICSIKCAISPSRGRCGLSFYYAGKRKGNPSHKCRLVENNGCCVIATNLRVQAWSSVAIIFLLHFHHIYPLFYLCVYCSEQYCNTKEGSVRFDSGRVKTNFRWSELKY